MNITLKPIAHGVAEGASLVGISYAKMKQEIAAGRIRSVKAGRRRLIPAQALLEWLADREAEAKA